jgi:L-seryl-tRNA(Ser) seleniumtransferase
VDQMLLHPIASRWVVLTSHGFVASEIQTLFQELREGIRSGNEEPNVPPDLETLGLVLDERLRARVHASLHAVVNATGVILHTNLGRAPLSSAAQHCLSTVSVRYTNLEYDLAHGKRSHRDELLNSALQEVLGCEAAVVVNNNAAALFLILNTLASGREVLVSRGEMVEIGGSFRIPDILACSGAKLREVGTTNKTRLGDYASAVGPDTALILRVHTSNFRIRGFTERPELPEMVELARRQRLPLVEDTGSGCLIDLRPFGIREEPVAQDSLRVGVDLVCFSADKLLGGPQAGIIAGDRSLIEPIRRNPLMRTYRVEKLIYGALEATLTSYRTGRALQDIPVLRMISATSEELRARARRFVRRLKAAIPDGIQAELVPGASIVGGGSCPDCCLPTTLIALTSPRFHPNAIESRLRSQKPAIILRVEEDKALLDLRTVFPDQEAELLDGLRKAL